VTKLLHTPENHALRFSLHNEIHARPPVSLKLPVSASHLALTLSEEEKAQEYEHLKALCSRFAVNPPPKKQAISLRPLILFYFIGNNMANLVPIVFMSTQ